MQNASAKKMAPNIRTANVGISFITLISFKNAGYVFMWFSANTRASEGGALVGSLGGSHILPKVEFELLGKLGPIALCHAVDRRERGDWLGHCTLDVCLEIVEI